MKKETLFRKVLVSDRLPTETGSVIGQCGDMPCLQQFYFDGKEFKDLFDDHPFPVKFWLEEIQLPSEEEFIQKVEHLTNHSQNKEWRDTVAMGYLACANYILGFINNKK